MSFEANFTFFEIVDLTAFLNQAQISFWLLNKAKY